jgi:hypothetical protein
MTTDEKIIENKQLRSDLDTACVALLHSKHKSRERSLAITKIQEAMMWLGMDLKALNDGKSCYEHGKDPSNTIVDPVPDGVHRT